MNGFTFRTIVVGAIHLCSVAATGFGQERESSSNDDGVSRYDRAVFVENGDDSTGDKQYFCAAVVSEGELLFLVAPRGRRLSGPTRIGIPATTAEAEWVDIREVSDWSHGDPWLDYDDVLISILPLASVSRDSDLSRHLHQVATPMESLARTPPARGTGLDIVGFPLWVDRDRHAVPPPFVWNSYVASGVLDLPESTGLPAGFLAAPPGSWYFIGAPVFRHVDDKMNVRCEGLVVRFLPPEGDDPPNWALIIPGGAIRDVIRGRLDNVEHRKEP